MTLTFPLVPFIARSFLLTASLAQAFVTYTSITSLSFMCNVILETLRHDNSDGNNDVKVPGRGHRAAVGFHAKGL